MYFPFLSLFLSLQRYARGPYILPDTPFVQDNLANISSKMGENTQKIRKNSPKLLLAIEYFIGEICKFCLLVHGQVDNRTLRPCPHFPVIGPIGAMMSTRWKSLSSRSRGVGECARSSALKLSRALHTSTVHHSSDLWKSCVQSLYCSSTGPQF